MSSDEAQRARKKALDLLARREHSHAELSAKLAARGFEVAIVQDVLRELADQGLLDETRFAEAFVAARSRRGMGPRRLRAELRQRGLADPAIDQALADPAFDWLELADKVRRKKFGDAPPADIRERARQTRYLEYRGFDSDAIRVALKS